MWALVSTDLEPVADFLSGAKVRGVDIVQVAALSESRQACETIQCIQSTNSSHKTQPVVCKGITTLYSSFKEDPACYAAKT